MTSEQYVQINGEMYVRVDSDRSWYSCPFCNSKNLTKESDNETFYGRTGCLDCDKWLNKLRIK